MDMVTPDDVKRYIAQGLSCDHLEVAGDGRHFEALIVSAAFDGKRLVNLMLDHEVGVSSQLYRVPRLDSDYFDESLG